MHRNRAPYVSISHIFYSLYYHDINGYMAPTKCVCSPPRVTGPSVTESAYFHRHYQCPTSQSKLVWKNCVWIRWFFAVEAIWTSSMFVSHITPRLTRLNVFVWNLERIRLFRVCLKQARVKQPLDVITLKQRVKKTASLPAWIVSGLLSVK